MTDAFIKQGDTSPHLTATLLDNDSVAVNLSSAVVKFHAVKKNASTVKIDGTCTLVDASAGKIRYPWVTADTDENGVFDFEFEVTYSDGSIETFPNDKHLVLTITEELN